MILHAKITNSLLVTQISSGSLPLNPFLSMGQRWTSVIQIMVLLQSEQILRKCEKNKNKKDYFQKKPTQWTQAGWFFEMNSNLIVYIFEHFCTFLSIYNSTNHKYIEFWQESTRQSGFYNNNLPCQWSLTYEMLTSRHYFIWLTPYDLI